MAGRKRALTFSEVQDRVLVALSQMALVRTKDVAKRADVKEKEAKEALAQLVIDKRVDQWPAIKAFKITTRGLEDAAAISTRVDTGFHWTWNKRGNNT